jgi:hypothetical protein
MRKTGAYAVDRQCHTLGYKLPESAACNSGPSLAHVPAPQRLPASATMVNPPDRHSGDELE